MQTFDEFAGSTDEMTVDEYQQAIEDYAAYQEYKFYEYREDLALVLEGLK